MLNELTFNPVEIHELKVLTVSEIEVRIESAFQAVNYGFLYVCVCFGLIRKKYEKLNTYYQNEEYIRYKTLLAKSEGKSILVGKNPELKEKYRFQAEEIKEKNINMFLKIVNAEIEMAKELGMNKSIIFPRTFNRYLDYLYENRRIKNIPEKPTVFQYSVLGLCVLEYPDFFQRISKEINIDNYRKKLLLFNDMLDFYGNGSQYKKEINHSIIKFYLNDIKELPFLEMKAKYNPERENQNEKSKLSSNGIRIKAGCLYFGDELILTDEEMEILQSNKNSMKKLKIFIQSLV